MELVESNFEMLECGEPCCYLHPPPPLWTGKSINPKCILHTLVRIIKDPMSEDQIRRQLYLLQDLKQGLTKGFWVQDIANSTKLIELLLCKGEILPAFYGYAKYLLSLMKYPPLMCRTNEILEYDRDVQSYFDFFGYMLVTSPKLAVRQIIVNSLKELLEYKKPLKGYAMPWEMLREQIELSNLPAILTGYMELCSNEIYFDLVQIVLEFTSFSSSMCMTLIKDGCLHNVMLRMDPEWQEHLGGPRPEHKDELRVDGNYPLDDSIMLIHALLEAHHAHPDNAIKLEVIAPTVEALWGLRYALRVYTLEKRYKNERNFIAALCLLFAECFPDAKHVQAGIVHDFALLATFGDATLGGKWPGTMQFDIDDKDDFEFKKTTMMGVIMYCDCLGADRIYHDEDVMSAMCTLLKANATRFAPQFRDPLLLTALHVLQHILPNGICDFLTSNGLMRIVNVLEELLINVDHEQRFDIYYQALKLTYNVIKLPTECKYLSDVYFELQSKLQRNIVYRMFDLDLKLKPQKIITQCLLILEILPENESAVDVEFVIALLKRILNPRPKDVGYIQRLLVAAISLIWRHGMHNEINFLYFIKLNGVYLMLDLMKNAEFAVQLICLGYLADLIQEGTAIPYVVTWQKDGVGIQALLMNIFRKECEMLGVEMLPLGVIADPKFPLMGKTQRNLFTNKEYTSDKSPCVTDLFLSCRPRIYAILQLLSERHGETLELVNDYYKTYDSNLTTEHKITKMLCDNYLVVKLGEMWMELDVDISPIEPVPDHRFLLDTLLAHFCDCGTHIQKMQNNWLAIARKNEHFTEEDFYNLLRETKLAPAIQALSEMKYLARAANANFRKSCYYMDPEEPEKGIIETHRTIQQFNTVQSCPQKLAIQSDVIVDPFAPIPPDPVSDDGDDNVTMYDASASEVSLPLEIECAEFKRDGMHQDNACVSLKKKKAKRDKSRSSRRSRGSWKKKHHKKQPKKH